MPVLAEKQLDRNRPQGLLSSQGQQIEHESAMCQPAASWAVSTTG